MQPDNHIESATVSALFLIHELTDAHFYCDWLPIKSIPSLPPGKHRQLFFLLSVASVFILINSVPQ